MPEKRLWGIQVVKKVIALVLGAMFGVVALVGLAPSAQAYPDVVIDLTAHPQVLYGGQQYTATATSDVTCDWTLEWNGVSKTDTSERFVTKFTAPPVSKITKIPLHGTCDYTAPSGRTSARSAADDAVWHRTIIITVLPRGSASSPPGSGTLPNTGGPSIWLLLAGLALAAGGATAVARSRGSKTS
ncbi:MAG: hypothetical protein JWP74_146 [Marmoricola sp.]|nr:hypothetical protein [Marmoricola sp.]